MLNNNEQHSVLKCATSLDLRIGCDMYVELFVELQQVLFDKSEPISLEVPRSDRDVQNGSNPFAQIYVMWKYIYMYIIYVYYIYI